MSWNLWEKRYGVRVPLRQVSVTRIGSSSSNSVVGAQADGTIFLDPRLSEADFDSVFRHELAHAFLSTRCRERLQQNVLASEAFAQWTSQDYRRLASHSTRFAFASVARNWFRKAGKDAIKPGRDLPRRNLEEALARLLAETGRESAWDKIFASLIEKCEDRSKDIARLLSIPKETAMIAQPVDFLLIDGLARETVLQEGGLDTVHPIGSTLKPVLLSVFPEMLTTKDSENTEYWACPNLSAAHQIRSWDWREALTKSCNGFFLAFQSEISNWPEWTALLEKVGAIDQGGSVSRAIGLVPGVELSLRQMVRLYEWISLISPFVVESLKRTPVDGTLSGWPESRWFVDRQIALKSGTVRGDDGVPNHAWIVAIGPRINGIPAFYAAIHGRGVGTNHLLAELKKRLASSKSILASDQIKSVEVQILGLVPAGTVGVECPKGVPLLLREENGAWRWAPRSRIESGKLVSGRTYACSASPLLVSFPLKDGERETRPYYGQLRVAYPSRRRDHSAAEARSARARSGSSLVLETSERYYVYDTIVSEYPRGNDETLKALAVVARGNAQAGRHESHAVCDTTHCQVFGHASAAPRALREKIRNAIDAVAADFARVAQDAPIWRPFSLGGARPWETYRDSGFIRSRLHMHDEIRAISLAAKDVKIYENSGQKSVVSCEFFRNQLQLLACPKKAVRTSGGWHFEGSGEGHGLGLDLIRANVMAAQGKSYREILAFFFGK